MSGSISARGPLRLADYAETRGSLSARDPPTASLLQSQSSSSSSSIGRPQTAGAVPPTTAAATAASARSQRAYAGGGGGRGGEGRGGRVRSNTDERVNGTPVVTGRLRPHSARELSQASATGGRGQGQKRGNSSGTKGLPSYMRPRAISKRLMSSPLFKATNQLRKGSGRGGDRNRHHHHHHGGGGGGGESFSSSRSRNSTPGGRTGSKGKSRRGIGNRPRPAPTGRRSGGRAAAAAALQRQQARQQEEQRQRWVRELQEQEQDELDRQREAEWRKRREEAEELQRKENEQRRAAAQAAEAKETEEMQMREARNRDEAVRRRREEEEAILEALESGQSVDLAVGAGNPSSEAQGFARTTRDEQRSEQATAGRSDAVVDVGDNARVAAAKAPKSAQEWAKHWDDEHNAFYYSNATTGHTQWEKPEGFDDNIDVDLAATVVEEEGGEEDDGENDGTGPSEEWTRHWDSSHQAYYYTSSKSLVSQWEPPDCEMENGPSAGDEGSAKGSSAQRSASSADTDKGRAGKPAPPRTAEVVTPTGSARTSVSSHAPASTPSRAVPHVSETSRGTVADAAAPTRAESTHSPSQKRVVLQSAQPAPALSSFAETVKSDGAPQKQQNVAENDGRGVQLTQNKEEDVDEPYLDDKRAAAPPASPEASPAVALHVSRKPSGGRLKPAKKTKPRIGYASLLLHAHQGVTTNTTHKTRKLKTPTRGRARDAKASANSDGQNHPRHHSRHGHQHNSHNSRPGRQDFVSVRGEREKLRLNELRSIRQRVAEGVTARNVAEQATHGSHASKGGHSHRGGSSGRSSKKKGSHTKSSRASYTRGTESSNASRVRNSGKSSSSSSRRGSSEESKQPGGGAPTIGAGERAAKIRAWDVLLRDFHIARIKHQLRRFGQPLHGQARDLRMRLAIFLVKRDEQGLDNDDVVSDRSSGGQQSRRSKGASPPATSAKGRISSGRAARETKVSVSQQQQQLSHHREGGGTGSGPATPRSSTSTPRKKKLGLTQRREKQALDRVCLSEALHQRQEKDVFSLLSSGCDPNAVVGILAKSEFTSHGGFEPDAGTTALHQAAALGFIDGVNKLLEFRASPELRDESGRTALTLALKMQEKLEGGGGAGAEAVAAALPADSHFRNVRIGEFDEVVEALEKTMRYNASIVKSPKENQLAELAWAADREANPQLKFRRIGSIRASELKGPDGKRHLELLTDEEAVGSS